MRTDPSPRTTARLIPIVAIACALAACQNVSLEVSPKPDRPANLSAAPSDASVRLVWNESARAERYAVYWKEGQAVSAADYRERRETAETAQTIGDLVNGQDYAFIVVALNESGASEPSQTAVCEPMPPPAAPLDVAASPGDAMAVVSWASSQGADGYILYYRSGGSASPGDPGVQRKADVSSPYTVTGLENGVAYAFAVAAYNASGEGPVGVAAVASPTNSNAPHSPSPADGTGGVPLAGPAALTWLTENPSGDQLAFDVYAGVGAIPASPVASGLATPAYTLTGPLAPHAEYRWRVSVNNVSKGYRSEGPEWGFTTANTPPPAPTPSAPAQAAADVSLAAWFGWGYAYDPDGDAVAYDLLIDTANPPAAVYSSGVASNTIQATGLAADTTYYWRVVARDGYGGSGESAVRSFRTVDPPAAPTALTASADPRYARVGLSWTAPAGPVSEYRIYRATSPGGQGASPIATTTGASHTDADFSVGDCAGTYYYRVRAVNAAGAGAMSAESSAVGSPPGKPAPTVTIKNHMAGRNFMDRYLLTITPNSGGAIASSPYSLSRVSPDPELTTVTGDVAIYVTPIFAVTSGAVTYTYRLRSRNEWGESAWSDDFSIVVPAALPTVYPTASAAGAGALSLSWTNPAGAAKLRIFLVNESYGTDYLTSVAAAPPTQGYTWTGLASGARYAFVIVPYDDTATPNRVTARLFDGDGVWSVDSSSFFVTVP